MLTCTSGDYPCVSECIKHTNGTREKSSHPSPKCHRLLALLEMGYRAEQTISLIQKGISNALRKLLCNRHLRTIFIHFPLSLPLFATHFPNDKSSKQIAWYNEVYSGRKK